LLEVLPKEALRWEVELSRNLLDAFVGVAQHLTRAAHDHLNNPLQGGVAALLLDDAGEIARCKMLLFGVERDIALALVILEQRDKERLEDAVLAIENLRFYALIA
jgi:hypothetical protein